MNDVTLNMPPNIKRADNYINLNNKNKLLRMGMSKRKIMGHNSMVTP
jgi:hypothetical protein